MATLSTQAVLANVASTLFKAGPTDIVAAPDVYGVSSASVINTPIGKFNPFNTSLLGGLMSGSTGLLGSLTSLTSLSNLAGIAAPAVSSITARLSSALGVPLSSLPSSTQTAITQAVNLTAGSAFGNAYVTVGGITRAVTSSNYALTSTAIQLVNQLTGSYSTASLIDNGSSASTVAALTGQLIALGLPEAVDALISSQSTTQPTSYQGVATPSVAQQALTQNVSQAIQASDLATVQLCITQLGVGGVLAVVPNAGLALIEAFKIPSGTLSTGYAALYATLTGLLDQLDSGWDSVMRDGVSYPSLAYASVASADALTLMKTDADTNRQIAAYIGHTYVTGTAVQKLSQAYPYMLKL